MYAVDSISTDRRCFPFLSDVALIFLVAVPSKQKDSMKKILDFDWLKQVR